MGLRAKAKEHEGECVQKNRVALVQTLGQRERDPHSQGKEPQWNQTCDGADYQHDCVIVAAICIPTDHLRYALIVLSPLGCGSHWNGWTAAEQTEMNTVMKTVPVAPNRAGLRTCKADSLHEASNIDLEKVNRRKKKLDMLSNMSLCETVLNKLRENVKTINWLTTTKHENNQEKMKLQESRDNHRTLPIRKKFKDAHEGETTTRADLNSRNSPRRNFRWWKINT